MILQKSLKVIAHLDADSFYTQVEYRRLGIPRDQPLVVVQWSSLIAIGYSARKYGIKRGDRVEIAKQKCPHLICVHVETKGAASSSHCDDGNACNLDRSSQKACLDRYRDASFEVMQVISQFCALIEKASIDECYLDLTAEVTRIMQQHDQGVEEDSSDIVSEFSAEELLGVNNHRLDPCSALDRPLLFGARLVAKIRETIQRETSFTVSAGISYNKMLCKLASSRYKPNKQTVVPRSAVQELLSSVPIKEIKGLGGKLGDQVLEKVGRGATPCKTALDLQRFSQQELIKHLGEKEGPWLYHICRGIDEEAVVLKREAQSMQAFKSFDPVHTVDGIRSWLMILADDLHSRLEKEYNMHRRRATVLSLVYRGPRQTNHREKWIAGKTSELTPMISRSIPMPAASAPPSGVPTQTALVGAGLTLFEKVGGLSALPCTRLGLSAAQFVQVSHASILNFFNSSNNTTSGATTRTTTTTSTCLDTDNNLPRPQDISSDTTAPMTFITEEKDEDFPRTLLCDKCKEQISLAHAKDWQEHLDWHMATELEKAYGGNNSDPLPTYVHKKRPRPTARSAANKTQKNTLTKFFKKSTN